MTGHQDTRGERVLGVLSSAGTQLVETAPHLRTILGRAREEAMNMRAWWDAQNATPPEVRAMAFQLHADLTNILLVSAQTGAELRGSRRPKVAGTLALRGLSEIAAQLMSRSHQLDARLRTCMPDAGASTAAAPRGSAEHAAPPITQLGWWKRHRLEAGIMKMLGELEQGARAIQLSLGNPAEADLFHVVGALRQVEGLAYWLDERVLRLTSTYTS